MNLSGIKIVPIIFNLSLDFHQATRKLHQTSTIPEVKLWQYLRGRRCMWLKFRRQFPIGPHVVDCVCLSHKLVIELDGGQHVEQLDYDNKRT